MALEKIFLRAFHKITNLIFIKWNFFIISDNFCFISAIALILNWSFVHQTVTQSAKMKFHWWCWGKTENFIFQSTKSSFSCSIATSSIKLLLYSFEFLLHWTEIDAVIDFHRLSLANRSLFLFPFSHFLICQLNFMHEWTFASFSHSKVCDEDLRVAMEIKFEKNHHKKLRYIKIFMKCYYIQEMAPIRFVKWGSLL